MPFRMFCEVRDNPELINRASAIFATDSSGTLRVDIYLGEDSLPSARHPHQAASEIPPGMFVQVASAHEVNCLLELVKARKGRHSYRGQPPDWCQ